MSDNHKQEECAECGDMAYLTHYAGPRYPGNYCVDCIDWIEEKEQHTPFEIEESGDPELDERNRQLEELWNNVFNVMPDYFSRMIQKNR